MADICFQGTRLYTTTWTAAEAIPKLNVVARAAAGTCGICDDASTDAFGVNQDAIESADLAIGRVLVRIVEAGETLVKVTDGTSIVAGSPLKASVAGGADGGVKLATLANGEFILGWSLETYTDQVYIKMFMQKQYLPAS